MTNLVNLTQKPYHLTDEAIAWVEATIQSMTLDEKIGQLFVNMGAERTEEYLVNMLDQYHIGAVRYNKGTATEVYDQNYILQTKSKIPLLIAANTEAGGDGAVTDGTKVGDEVKIAATNEPRYAYEMGRISGQEAAAVGCNMSFAPIVDLSRNWRNPIIASRTWSDQVDTVITYSKEYMRGIQSYGILPTAKHFPGDGIDERDHHLSFASNPMAPEEWDQTFGRIYGELIEAGLPAIMAGHIHLPKYEQALHPERTLDEMLPASLNKTLLDELLRGKLGFNGLVVTDASHMVAMTASMPRRELLPTAVEAGCDLFLFFNDPKEDFNWMKEGYLKGALSEERLIDALRRILGLKAKLGLHKTPRNAILPPKAEALRQIATPESKVIVREVADRAITLVKDKQKDLFPIVADKYPHILIVPVKGYTGGFGAMIAGNTKEKPEDLLKKELEKRGMIVSIWENTEEKIQKLPAEARAVAIMNVYAQKKPLSELTKKYDLVINLSNVNSGGTTQRIIWPASKGTPDSPFYVHEIPTIFISIQNPFDLADVPQVGTYINAYDGKPITIEELAKKLTGESTFKGVSPVDAFCGLVDTHLWRGKNQA